MMNAAAPEHPYQQIIDRLRGEFGADAVSIEEADRERFTPADDEICVRVADIGRHQVRIEYRSTDEDEPANERRYWMVVLDSTLIDEEEEEYCEIADVPDLERAIAGARFLVSNLSKDDSPEEASEWFDSDELDFPASGL